MKATKHEAYWHSQLESNQHRGSQSPLCYRYTMTAHKSYKMVTKVFSHQNFCAWGPAPATTGGPRSGAWGPSPSGTVCRRWEGVLL